MGEQLRLYSYWRSSAAYRVRIGLNLKGLAYETLPVHLVRDGGEQHRSEYAAVNPQQLVPTLKHGVRVIRQSLAILEYLDEAWPSPPLLPMTAPGSAAWRNWSPATSTRSTTCACCATSNRPGACRNPNATSGSGTG